MKSQMCKSQNLLPGCMQCLPVFNLMEHLAVAKWLTFKVALLLCPKCRCCQVNVQFSFFFFFEGCETLKCNHCISGGVL